MRTKIYELLAALCGSLMFAGCARGTVEARSGFAIPSVNIVEGRAYDSYAPVPPKAAAILGCATAPRMPICEVTHPSAEEDSAFRAESVRLLAHADARCRELGSAIEANRHSVRMYRNALVVESGNGRLYGVGHAYALDSAWLVRVARRIDELNERTLEEKKRTLRHEMSHTLGATESADGGWSAEDYANGCA